jgi:histidine ammonia-lyase
MSTVTITEKPLALEDLLAIVDGAEVELAADARTVIAASRAVVDSALASRTAVYGLTTQVGHGRDTRLTEEQIRSEQMFLVMSHSGGIGPPLSTPRVRAARAVRLNGIARGWSGASPEVADILVAMLNAGVHPVVPEIGSVGAGDLAPMAGMAQVAIGQGRPNTKAKWFPEVRRSNEPGSSPSY